MTPRQVLDIIWEQTPTLGAPFIGTIERKQGRKTFSEEQFRGWPAQRQLPGVDVYFTPLKFEGDRRTNEGAPGAGVLFADLDTAHPGVLAPDMKPNVAWETSPGSFQGVWFLAETATDMDRWADINQRLTYHTGADKGGWSASKLLRVPLTINYKYDPPERGQLLWVLEGYTHHLDWWDYQLPKLAEARRVEGAIPKPPDHKEWKALLREVWPKLPLGVKSDLLSQGKRDRSLAMVHLVSDLSRAELTPVQVFGAAWGVAWNKFRTDRYAPETVWQMVVDFQNLPD